MAALEGAADARAEIEMRAEPGRGATVEVEIEERPRPLARPARGLGDREAVEVAARDHAPARPRQLHRSGGAGDQEHAQRRDCVEAEEPPLYTPRMDERALEKDLDRQIVATHRRFVKAMDARLGSMSADTKERYFAVLSTLVAKLETAEKPMREIMQEMVAEAAGVILQEMQG